MAVKDCHLGNWLTDAQNLSFVESIFLNVKNCILNKRALAGRYFWKSSIKTEIKRKFKDGVQRDRCSQRREDATELVEAIGASESSAIEHKYHVIEGLRNTQIDS